MFNSEKKPGSETTVKPIKPNRITAGKLLIAFLVLFIPVLALKAYHMFTYTDPETGFFLDRANISVYGFYIIIVAGVLILTLLSYLSSRGGNLPTGAAFRGRGVVTGIISIGAAACLFYRAFDIYTELSKLAAGMNVSLFAASKLEGHNVFYFFQAIFAALGALWLLLYAISRFAGKDFCTKLRIFSLTPAIWGACRVIEYFTVTMSYLNVAELFCDIFTAVLCMVFLFCLARTAADVEGDGAVWTVFASGLSLSLVGISTQLVRVFLLITGRVNMLVTDRPFSALFLIIPLLALAAVICAVSYKKKMPVNTVADWEVSDVVMPDAPVSEDIPSSEPDVQQDTDTPESSEE